MGFSQRLKKFVGRPVAEFDPGKGLRSALTRAHFVGADVKYGEVEATFLDRFVALIDHPAAPRVKALVVGCWDGATEGRDSAPAVEAIVSACDRLTGLEALFFGDILFSEYEISWLRQSDVSAILNAYPNLREFHVRGTNGLALGGVAHRELRKLVIQSGGLNDDVMRDINRCAFPNLEHLELWLGSPEYWGNVTAEHLGPVLSGKLFPKLRYLGLRNRENVHELLPVLAKAPVLKKVKQLDLSKGTLNDEEAAFLRTSAAPFRKLQGLDLSDNFLTKKMIAALKKSKIKVVSKQQRTADRYEDEEYRYCVVGE